MDGLAVTAYCARSPCVIRARYAVSMCPMFMLCSICSNEFSRICKLSKCAWNMLSPQSQHSANRSEMNELNWVRWVTNGTQENRRKWKMKQEMSVTRLRSLAYANTHQANNVCRGINPPMNSTLENIGTERTSITMNTKHETYIRRHWRHWTEAVEVLPILIFAFWLPRIGSETSLPIAMCVRCAVLSASHGCHDHFFVFYDLRMEKFRSNERCAVRSVYPFEYSG